MAEPPSSPPGDATSAEDALLWYKAQYEMVESELAEFRDSSRELEKELEKDLERAEKQERVFQEKAETLGFEVEEWKRKYKESKTEASAAQNSLEKEITTLRDSNRSLQLKLRDIEVANDDFERQARNTTSSLEDMESKFNQAIERAVMMEEEIRMGEQEREQLRIDSQRLREELADLKIEAELMQDKIKKQEARHLSAISTDTSLLGSPTFDKNADDSPNSTASSPLVTTPPGTKSLSAQAHDPPSPPMSDASAPVPQSGAVAKTPVRAAGALARKSRLPSLDGNATPKPRSAVGGAARPPGGRLSGMGSSLRTPANRSTRSRPAGHKIPVSNSLTHIRTLTAQMQRLEARVHSARSRLPGPAMPSPRVSPRSASRGPGSILPSTVTIRSRKRTLGSSTSSMAGDETTPTNVANARVSKSHVPRLSASGAGRLSFGPLPNRGPDPELSRPSSRTSLSSYARPSSRSDMVPPPRPMSRTSMSGARTPLGRPRSSLSGSMHSHSASIGRMDEEEDDDDAGSRTPSRRGTYSKLEMEAEASGIPVPGSTIPTPTNRRQSEGRRTSSGRPMSSLRRPSSSAMRTLSDLGETY